MDELMFLDNPDDELELIEYEKPKKRKRKKNPEPIAVATPLLLLVAGYLGWCGYKQYKTGSWTWQPWKGIAIGRRLPLGRPLRQNYRDFDRAVENMMRPAPSVDMGAIKWKEPKIKDEEQIGFIYP